MKKRFFSMLMALCMVLTLLPGTALAADDGTFTADITVGEAPVPCTFTRKQTASSSI